MCVWIFGGAVGGGRRSFVGRFVCTDGVIGFVLVWLLFLGPSSVSSAGFGG